MTTCATCDLGLAHCHGLLVEHDDGTATCLDGCGGPRAVHDDAAPCGTIGYGCCEPAPEVVDLPYEPARAA
jgi:hypothetical protein